jgi:hypothetical protein
MIRRTVLLWLFPVLLLAQAGGLAHGVSHLVSDAPIKDRGLPIGLCDQCVSFAKLAHLAACEATVDLEPATAVSLLPETEPPCFAATVSEHRSRGPPIVL